MLTKSGISGTNSALARSWLEWGLLLKEPQFDCIVVLEKENPNGCQGHVEFFTKIKNDRIFLSPAVSLRLQMTDELGLSFIAIIFPIPLSRNSVLFLVSGHRIPAIELVLIFVVPTRL